MSQVTKRRMRVLAAASAAAMVGLVWLVVKAWGVQSSWALAALANPVGRAALLWLLGGMVFLGILVAVLIRLQPEKLHGHPRVLHGDQDGTATVEFVLLMPIGLLIVLVITQAALLFQANMVVNYAAFAAVREASVALSLDLPEEGGTQSGKHNLVNNPDYPLAGGSTKLDLIKRTACLALVPISGECDSPPDADSSGSTSTDFMDPGGRAVAAATTAALQSPDATNTAWQDMEARYNYSTSSWPWVGRVEKKYNYALRYTQITLAEPEHWRDGNPDNDCPYSNSKPITGYDNWNWDTGNYQETINGTTYTNGIPFCPHFAAQRDYYKWEELHLRVIYQFLLDVPYAGPLLGGTAASVPGITGTAWLSEIHATSSIMNEGGPDEKPKS